MTTLKIHDLESAPQEGKALLENSQKAYGMIPGLHGVLAGAPKILEAKLFRPLSALENNDINLFYLVFCKCSRIAATSSSVRRSHC